MIISSIDNLTEGSVLDRIIARILTEDVSDYPDGLTEIVGEDIFVNRVRGKARLLEDTMAEVHHEYIDVHLVLSGSETLGFGIDPFEPKEGLDQVQENDCVLRTDIENEQFITLNRGQYCVFQPKEWHRPMITLSEPEGDVDKVVIKVRASMVSK